MASTNKLSLRSVIGKGYDEFWRCTKRYRVVKGSRGSKKSTTTALWYIYKMMEFYYKYNMKPNVLVVRRYFNTNWDSTRAQLVWAINQLQVTHLWKIPKSEHTLTFTPSGQQILFRGLDDPQSVTSITVPDGYLCWVWFEEAFQVTSEEDFNKIDMSIRGEVPPPLFKNITLTFNPWSDKSWLKRRFFDTPDGDVLAMTTNYMVNEFLGADDVAIYEKMKEMNPKRYAIEGLGEWGVSEGLIYTKWRVEEFDIQELIDTKRKEKDIRGLPNFVSVNGIDFGYNDPTAFVGAYADKRNYTIYVWYEFYETTMENRKIASRLIQDGFSKTVIKADSEDPRTINELRLLGLKGIKGARKGKGSVEGGIQKLQDYEIVVHPRCVHMIESLSNYAWKKDRTTDKITNVPEHDFSHICVAGDTLVSTAQGLVPIKDMVGKHMEVWCYDADLDCLVLREAFNPQMTQRNARLWKVELVDGTVLRLTEHHKVLTKRGYVECRDLKQDDEVMCTPKVGECLFSPILGCCAVKSVTETDDFEDVYNMTVDEHHNFVANGVVVKNCDALRYGCEDLSKFGVQV